ncbi:unnamed protein product [Coregonus sp. 'balchen']|nr:unnamed protein product [Coregonus sp. 'balchen']
MAALSGGEMCVKYLMFAFNLIFWLAGTGVLAIGLWLRFDPKTRGLFEGTESPYFFFFLLIIFAIEVAAGIWGFSNQSKVPKHITSPVLCYIKALPLLLSVLHYISFLALCHIATLQVVDDITQFYMETYQNYQNTRQDTLRETLRLIQTGVIMCSVVDSAKDTCPRRDGLDSLITKMFGMIFSMLLCCAIRKSREIV